MNLDTQGRTGGIWSVCKDDINIVELKTLKSLFRALDDAGKKVRRRMGSDTSDALLFSRQAAIVGTLAETPEELGGDDEVGATKTERLDRTATGKVHNSQQNHPT